MSTPFADDLPALARAGFASVELWLTKLETFLESHSVVEAANLLADLGLHAAAASGQGGCYSQPARNAARRGTTSAAGSTCWAS